VTHLHAAIVALRRVAQHLGVAHCRDRPVLAETGQDGDGSQRRDRSQLDGLVRLEQWERATVELEQADRARRRRYDEGISPVLLEDVPWLSFARGSSEIEYEHGEYRKEKKKYMGKTYDSVDSIAEFFKQRNQQMGQTSGSWSKVQSPKPKVAATNPTPSPGSASGEIVPGSYVKHSKYGRGLVLRREGAGESVKLTVSFPGYGQKKLVEKYANLERA